MSNETLSETLKLLGFTHRRNSRSENTGKRTIERDGIEIGEFTAKEAWEFIRLYTRKPLDKLRG